MQHRLFYYKINTILDYIYIDTLKHSLKLILGGKIIHMFGVNYFLLLKLLFQYFCYINLVISSSTNKLFHYVNYFTSLLLLLLLLYTSSIIYTLLHLHDLSYHPIMIKFTYLHIKLAILIYHLHNLSKLYSLKLYNNYVLYNYLRQSIVF